MRLGNERHPLPDESLGQMGVPIRRAKAHRDAAEGYQAVPEAGAAAITVTLDKPKMMAQSIDSSRDWLNGDSMNLSTPALPIRAIGAPRHAFSGNSHLIVLSGRAERV